MISRESTFLLNNIVLVSALFTIFLGTIFPLISEAVARVKVECRRALLQFRHRADLPLFSISHGGGADDRLAARHVGIT